MKWQGGCLCGQVRYEVSGDPLAVVICHCINCQKQSGSTFSINMIGQSEQIALQGKLSTFADKNDTGCLLYTSPSPRDLSTSRMPSSA